MTRRPRRILAVLATAIAVLGAIPAAASAAEGLTVTPSDLQAGGHPTINASLQFAPAAGDTPKTVTVALAAGLLFNLTASPACVTGIPQLTPACQIGSGNVAVSTSPTPAPGALYLVPPPSSADIAGIELNATGLPAQVIGVSVRSTPPAGLNLTTTLPDVAPSAQITALALTLDATLNGQPFTRMPTGCSQATSSMTVTYYSGATGSASGAFTPTGCSTLPYGPQLAATVIKDPKDTGALVRLAVTQGATEAATSGIVFGLPSSIQPNVLALVPCVLGAGCTIGSATATSPLLPASALSSGTITLAGPATAPAISISFPAPYAVTISGTVNVSGGSLVFANLPDLPLTSLVLNVTGPNGEKAFTTTCARSSISTTLTAHSGATHTSSAPITTTGCAAAPSASGSLRGLAAGHPRLRLKVTHGTGAPDVGSVSVSLASGLRFARAAIGTRRSCTRKGARRTCVTSTRVRGLTISGARVKRVALRAGKLSLTFQHAVAGVTLTASGPLLVETRSLKAKVAKHRVTTLSFRLGVADAHRTSTTIALKLRAGR